MTEREEEVASALSAHLDSLPRRRGFRLRGIQMTRAELTGWSIPVSVGIVSLVLSRSLPIEKIAWSGWVYFSMVILVPLHRFFYNRRLKANEIQN
jgi:hypothetical protein